MKQAINTLKVNEKNPRSITTKKMDLLVDSILTFPKMLTIRPIVIDDNCIVLGGNMRTRALTIISEMDIYAISDRLMAANDFDKKSENEKAALIDYWTEWLKHPEVDVVYASELTEAEQKRFIIEDNASFGTWDYDALSNDWDSVDLNNWGVDVWNAETNVNIGEDGTEKETAKSLHSFKIGNITVNMTDEEFELLSSKVNQYVDTYQNTFGFINWLCNGDN